MEFPRYDRNRDLIEVRVEIKVFFPCSYDINADLKEKSPLLRHPWAFVLALIDKVMVPDLPLRCLHLRNRFTATPVYGLPKRQQCDHVGETEIQKKACHCFSPLITEGLKKYKGCIIPWRMNSLKKIFEWKQEVF